MSANQDERVEEYMDWSVKSLAWRLVGVEDELAELKACSEKTCDYQEPHRHGFPCGLGCKVCEANR